MTATLFTGARLFDGTDWHTHAGVLAEEGHVVGVVGPGQVPEGATPLALDGGLLVPGFVDLQVNGGGGAQFNDAPDAETIARICAAHQRFGTTALLATLITDTRDIGLAALAAGRGAHARSTLGFLGLHMEGPHLSVARKGTHDPALIRPMEDHDLAELVHARRELPVLLATVAPESVSNVRIAALAEAGVVVSLGHSDCGYEEAMAAFRAGARMATHLHNAMSPLTSRAPGLVGAALDSPDVSFGLIADGIHVHPATLRLSVAARRRSGHPFLVTDAMAVTGSTLREITLNGRTITRAGGALRLADGTLAGADLTMIDAVRFMHEQVGVPLDEALRMAALYPARAVGVSAAHGHLNAGARADMVHLADDLTVRAVWIGGTQVFSA